MGLGARGVGSSRRAAEQGCPDTNLVVDREQQHYYVLCTLFTIEQDNASCVVAKAPILHQNTQRVCSIEKPMSNAQAT